MKKTKEDIASVRARTLADVIKKCREIKEKRMKIMRKPLTSLDNDDLRTACEIMAHDWPCKITRSEHEFLVLVMMDSVRSMAKRCMTDKDRERARAMSKAAAEERDREALKRQRERQVPVREFTVDANMNIKVN